MSLRPPVASPTVDIVRNALRHHSIGAPVEFGLDGARLSAVLVALADGPDGAEVLLTRRSMAVGSHRGQVSFPGGRLDDGETPLAAALREAHEEVGLAPDVVSPFAELSHLETPVSWSHIVPIVAEVPFGRQLTAETVEVDRVFWVPLAELMSPDVHHSEVWERDGQQRLIHFFDVADENVWGATGAMLYELLGIVSTDV